MMPGSLVSGTPGELQRKPDARGGCASGPPGRCGGPVCGRSPRGSLDVPARSLHLGNPVVAHMVCLVLVRYTEGVLNHRLLVGSALNGGLGSVGRVVRGSGELQGEPCEAGSLRE